MGQRSVSVVIPTNRGGPYLAEAAASVAAQTVRVAEVILVDDGSAAPGLADTAEDLGIAYVRQEASGLSVARNTGARRATGEWIAFLDDDDVWHPDRIERQLDALEAHPEAIACAAGGWYMDAAGTPFGDGWVARPASAGDMLSGIAPFPRITTLLIRRDSYLVVGGCDPAAEPSEDNDLIMRLLQVGDFTAVDAPLVGYRRHSSNVTARNLRGRSASHRNIVRQRDLAARRGDADLAARLEANLRAFRDQAARENLADLSGAFRRREWSYARDVAWWGLRTVPGPSVGALRDRVSRRIRQ